MGNKIETLFLQEKPLKTLRFLGSNNQVCISDVSTAIDSTFPHTSKIVYKMERMGIVRLTKVSRSKVIELTEYGKQLEEALKKLTGLEIDGGEENGFHKE